MPADAFRLKKFSVRDDQCQMKVGTDGVLLGAWVDVTNAHRILDIGTGSGLIALMLAQRTPDETDIDAVEPLEPDVGQARENVRNSPWHHRIHVQHYAIQDFVTTTKYDLIVANPPFFSSSLLPPSGKRATVRHTVALTHVDLLDSVSRLLVADGRFAVILPAAEGDQFRQKALNFNLKVVRSLAFFSRPGKKQERWLFELSNEGGPVQEETINLYEGTPAQSGERWSAAYHSLTRDFYLQSR